MIDSFTMTTWPLMHYVLSIDFWWNIKSPRWLSPPTAQIWSSVILAFPKTKITFEREEISDHWWDSGKYDGAADGEWENCVRSHGAYFEGDWHVIILCTMFCVLSSINVSIFHIIWLDTFWTNLILFLLKTLLTKNNLASPFIHFFMFPRVTMVFSNDHGHVYLF